MIGLFGVNPYISPTPLYQQGLAVSSPANTSTNTLGTYTLPASMLANVGDMVEIEAWANFTATSQNKHLGIKVGGTVINGSGVAASTRINGWAKARVVKTGASTQSYVGWQDIGGGNEIAAVGTLALTDTATIAIVVESASAAGLAGDIVLRGMLVRFSRAA